jgi:hypothetical protein
VVEDRVEDVAAEEAAGDDPEDELADLLLVVAALLGVAHRQHRADVDADGHQRAEGLDRRRVQPRSILSLISGRYARNESGSSGIWM